MGPELDLKIKQAIELTTNKNRANIAFLLDLPTTLFSGFDSNDVSTEFRQHPISPVSIHPIISVTSGAEEISQSIFRPSMDMIHAAPITTLITDILPMKGGDLFSYEFAFRTEPIIVNGKKHFMYGARACISAPDGGFLLLNLFPVIDGTDLVSPFSSEEVFSDSYDADYKTKYAYERVANIFGHDRKDLNTRIPSKTKEQLTPIYFKDCLLMANGIYRDTNGDYYEFKGVSLDENYGIDFIFSDGMVEYRLSEIIDSIPNTGLLRRRTDPQRQHYLADYSPFMHLLNPKAEPLECGLTALPEYTGGRTTSHLSGEFEEMIIHHLTNDEIHAQAVRKQIHEVCLGCAGDVIACKRPRPTREISNFTEHGSAPTGKVTLSTRARFNPDQGLYNSIIPKK